MFQHEKPFIRSTKPSPHNFFFILGFFFLCFFQPAHADPTIQISSAKKIISNATTPPIFEPAQSVTLPDHWQHEQQQFYGSVWYQIEIKETQNIKQQWAIYLPEVNMNAEIWLNNTRLGSGGSMKKPLSRYWHLPMMFVFSPSDLNPQKNFFYIRVVAYANEFGLLGNLYLGDRNAIKSTYQHSLFSTGYIHIVSGILSGVYAFFMMLVWSQRRDPVFFWVAAICATWSISSMNLYVVNPWFPDIVWEKLMLLSMAWLPLIFFMLIRRLNNRSYSPSIEGTIFFGAILINVVMVFASPNNIFFISTVFQIYSMSLGLIGVIDLLIAWLKNKTTTPFMMLIAFSIIAIFGIHDMLIQSHVIESGQPFWLNYSVPIILLLIGYLMVSRFLNAVQNSERLNKELESRVNKAQQKIEADYEKILHLETKQASNNERERIYRNLHDDMGAKLLSIVYQSESNETGQLARSAMNDLRALVSKKPQKPHLLSNTLNNWYQSTLQRCKEAHFQLHWKQHKIPLQIFINDDDFLNLQRLQTEAVSNVLKHSKGADISINIQLRFHCLRICVYDHAGFSQVEQWSVGRGVSNMRFRIKQLQGKIHWLEKSNKTGAVCWIIPLTKLE